MTTAKKKKKKKIYLLNFKFINFILCQTHVHNLFAFSPYIYKTKYSSFDDTRQLVMLSTVVE